MSPPLGAGGGAASVMIHEGWLRKSPPLETEARHLTAVTSVLFRPRWRKRWMVLVQAAADTASYQLLYYTDQDKAKLKGSINLRHCMSISSNSVVEADKKSKQVFTFSISTPDRVYQFSSDSKQLVQTWIEILTNACRQNPFFSSSGSASTSACLDSSTRSPAPSCSPAALTAPVTPASSGKRSLADPYIHLTECYSGNKAQVQPPVAPPRPAKSSLDLRRRTESESENIRGDIKYLNLHFPSSVIRQEEEDSDHNDNIVKDKEEEVIYRKIDFVKTKAFNETRRQVENSRYNITQ